MVAARDERTLPDKSLSSALPSFRIIVKAPGKPAWSLHCKQTYLVTNLSAKSPCE